MDNQKDGDVEKYKSFAVSSRCIASLKGYVVLPQPVIQLAGEGVVFNTYIALMCYTRPQRGIFHTFVSYDTIGTRTGKTKTTIWRAIKRLAEDGHITLFKKMKGCKQYISLDLYLKSFNIDVKTYHETLMKEEKLQKAN